VPEVLAHPIPRGVGLALIAGIAVLFASNHVAARFAFDHGTSVVTAVLVRSAVTALAVAVLLRATGTPCSLAAPTRRHAVLIGLALSVQSVCLYASVARIPVALALLTFNSFPVVLALLSWATGGERPARRTAIAMPVILSGLVLLTVLYGTAFTSLFIVLPRLGAVNSAPAMNVEPIASMALAWLLLGQRIGWLQVAGGVLVVGAIVWTSLGPKPAPRGG
jgi:drug/metabolite transporter (DMT)-like permease